MPSHGEPERDTPDAPFRLPRTDEARIRAVEQHVATLHERMKDFAGFSAAITALSAQMSDLKSQLSSLKGQAIMLVGVAGVLAPAVFGLVSFVLTKIAK
jgi:hypothetical protein